MISGVGIFMSVPLTLKNIWCELIQLTYLLLLITKNYHNMLDDVICDLCFFASCGQ